MHDLCENHHIIAVQEHWLDESNMNKLSMVSSNFVHFGVSGMSDCLKRGVHRGRPFGGVAFLWHKSIAPYVKMVDSSVDGRCLAITYNRCNRCLLLVNMFLPCNDGSDDYRATVNECAGFIDHVIECTVHTDIILIGDTNFPCNVLNSGFRIFNKFLLEHDLVDCDDLSGHENTYVNNALNCASCIDHIFVSCLLRTELSAVHVIDSEFNFSDHRPLSCCVNVKITPNGHGNAADKKHSGTSQRSKHEWRRFAARWDKANLADFYDSTRSFLSTINLSDCCTECRPGCSCVDHKVAIDRVDNSVVGSLQSAELVSIPRVPVNSLKPFWNEHLDELKEKSIFWCRLWKDAGRPRARKLFRIKFSCVLNYKNAIRQAVWSYEHTFDDELYEHFVRREPSEFWKSWNKKFSKNALKPSMQIDGCQDNRGIADTFAKHFGDVFKQADKDLRVDEAEFRELFKDVSSRGGNQCCSSDIDQITVELVDDCIRHLKKGKACGPDNLSAEHLLHVHPILTLILTKLFRAMALHSYVPEQFGRGIIIPLVKNKCGDVTSSSNYRAITLIPVISKALESVLLRICDKYLDTDETQFVFKKRIRLPRRHFCGSLDNRLFCG